MSDAAIRVLNSGMRLPPMPTLRDVVKLYNLRAVKHLSQNFLMDERLTDKIVKSAGRIDPHDVVLEVGPGPGGITRSIIRREPQRLILVEKDARFLPTLELLKQCAERINTNVQIHNEDILKFDMEKHLPQQFDGRLHLIGNLPFSISTCLLLSWFEDISLQKGAFRHDNTRMTLTFQKEVAERICAPPNNKQRCRLSVMSQIWTQPVFKFLIPGTAFTPQPDVDVGVVHLIPLKVPKTNLPFTLVEKVLRHAFNMRQKYSRRSLSTLFPPEQRDQLTLELFQKADVKDIVRPYQLTVEECLRLANVYYDFIKRDPEISTYNYRGPKKPHIQTVAMAAA